MNEGMERERRRAVAEMAYSWQKDWCRRNPNAAPDVARDKFEELGRDADRLMPFAIDWKEMERRAP